MMGINWSKSLKVLFAGCLLLVQSMLVIESGSSSVEAASAEGPYVTQSISVGTNHSCAVMSDKTVKCWGANDRGQLGDGTITNRDFPVNANGITNAISVAVGYTYSCALTEIGTVLCWGSSMQTGSGDTTLITGQPTAVSDLSGVTQISAGIWQTCALKSSGEVFCWGVRPDIDGPIPNSFTIASVPYQVTGLNQAVEISVGMSSACALISDGSVKCWGTQTNGALGDGASASTRIANPVAVNGISNAVSISLGSSSGACAVLSTGSVKCWGSDSRFSWGRIRKNSNSNIMNSVAL
jgi:alpha-tubulin suppressor-like RCC1 family protein